MAKSLNQLAWRTKNTVFSCSASLIICAVRHPPREIRPGLELVEMLTRCYAYMLHGVKSHVPKLETTKLVNPLTKPPHYQGRQS